MKKLLLTLILLSGCSQLQPNGKPMPTTDEKVQLLGQTLIQLASKHNRIVNCIESAGNSFKKVSPCLKATPAPVETKK